MNTKILLSSLAVTGLASTLAASAAHADKIKVGGQLQVLPALSSLKAEGLGLDESASAEPAFGVLGTFDYAVHPNIDIGLAPRIVFGLKADSDADSATQFDLAARVTGHAQVAPKLDIFGFAAPGYSILSMPNWPDQVDQPSGLVLGFGGGAGGQDVDVQTKLFHLGVGIKAAL
jgi:hypothetical protein